MSYTVAPGGFTGQIHAHLTGRPGLKGQAPVKAPAPKNPAAPKSLFNGAPLWADLHGRALALDKRASDTGEATEDAKWLARFRQYLPCGECKQHWDMMQVRTPPDFANYFEWTVARHNEVNARLAKPEMTVAEAREKWAPDAPLQR